VRTFRNFSFLFPSLICLAILGQSTRTHAQSAANSALPPPPHAKEIHLKHVLVIAQTKGWEHDSIPACMVAVYNMGKESGLWDTTLRTDTKLLTKKELKANAKNLAYFDLLVFCSTTGELDLDDGQKQDMLSFVHDDGKGFVGIHAALDTNYTWPEYGEMIGGWFNDLPLEPSTRPSSMKTRRSPPSATSPPPSSNTTKFIRPNPGPATKSTCSSRSIHPSSTTTITASTATITTLQSHGASSTAMAASFTPRSATLKSPGTIPPSKQCTSKPSSGPSA